MEVEIKLALGGQAAHEKLCSLLSPYHRATHAQDNFFFDGARRELESQRAALRLRFTNGDSRCVASLKAKPLLEGGVSRVEEQEEDIADVAAARRCVEQPHLLLTLGCALISTAASRFGVSQFVCLGGFRNVRNVFDWEGEQLEVDETHYAFGISFEIECETPEPDRVKPMLEALLDENGIAYRNSSANKFGVFRKGSLQA